MKKNNILFAAGVLMFCLVSHTLVEASQNYSILSETVNIRSGPGINYAIMWQAEQYYPLSVIKKKGNWYLFKDFEGDKGWVHNSLIGKVKSAIVVKNKCNVRSGPSIKNLIRFTVEKGVPLKVLKKRGDWIKIEHADGYIGWIHKTLVRFF